MPPPEPRLHRSRVADQIAADLRRQILDGELPDGAQLPSERDLATRYNVSPATIRESIRALTTVGLLNTRSGSRSVVTANGDTLLRLSIASVAQFEKMQAGDLLELLGVLITYAAQRALEHATDADIERLRAATQKTADLTDPHRAAADLYEFFTTLTAISHNPLLEALGKALTDIHIGMALTASDADTWGRVATQRYPERVAITDAIARRDPVAPDLVRDYHQHIVTLIRSRTRTEPTLSSFLSTWAVDAER